MKEFNLILHLCLLMLFFSCTNNSKVKTTVDFETSKTHSDTHTIDNKKVEPVYIAIASMTSPQETFIYYNELLDFISKKIGHPVYYKQKKTYKEVDLLLEKGEVDFAFICSGSYAVESAKNNIDLLVAPVINNSTYYRAYIITQKNASINSFEDFENKSFAFSDPLSNTGRIYPLRRLTDFSAGKDHFFSKTIYTYGHDISIQMVNRGIIDGASVHGLIFDYISEFHPERVENVKIIEKSERFGIPPVVTSKLLSKSRFQQYRDVFLEIHKDSIGKKILEKLKIEKFVMVNDSIYDNVRLLRKYATNENR